MERIKFSVIGCGSIGKRHIAILNGEPGAEIVSVCDTKENELAIIDQKYPHISTYADYHKMLKDTTADIVSICTPHSCHAQMAIDVAQSGKNILVEKPMSLRSTDAESMIRAAEENNVHLIVVKQNRYNVPVILTKQALDEKKLGRIFMVECNIFWNRFDNYYKESDWRGKKEFEGGALYTQASHFIDLLIWWFGDLKSAKTMIATKNHNIEIEDCGTSVLEFESGVLGSLLWTTCVYNKNYEGSITIVGEYGTIKIGGQYLNKIEYWDVRAFPLSDKVQFDDKPNLYGTYSGSSSNHDKLIHDIVTNLNTENNNLVPGEEGIKTVQAIEMIYKNATT
jgi:UDP-N-acetyl-2-amino-2-deoxyglucuronate dehydrogenase